MPWLSRRRARRDAGTWSRWEEIVGFLGARPRLTTAVDLGCNTGFFCIALAENGLQAVGIDRDPRALAMACLASTKAGVTTRVHFLCQDLTSGGEVLEADRDITLCLSVWHHLVADHGLTQATRVLSDAWRRTRSLMFFETGGSEMPSEFALPEMGDDPDIWLREYLSDACEGGRIEALGCHEAFDPKRQQARRRLFALTR